LLEGDGHIGLIVIAENTEYSAPAADGAHQFLNLRVDSVAGPMYFETVITRQHAQIHREFADAVAESFGQAANAVNVQIGKMQDAKSMQPWRQVRECEAQMAYMELERVAAPSLVEAGCLQSHFQQGPYHAVSPKQQLRMTVGCRALAMPRFGGAPRREAIFQTAYVIG
jgi:hypothetical protein